MRVIAGRLGGRQFMSPHGHRTHPMSDKMRGALFNTLGDLSGLSVLDAFAGSGGLSYEAVSRGASRVTAIERDKTAQRTIAENIAALGLGSQIKLVRANAAAWLRTTDEAFDIVLCDPPYEAYQPALLTALAARVRAEGLLVLSLPPQARIALPDTCQLLTVKNYGDGELRFYRCADQ